jgi:hypothetical protein
MTAGKSFRYGAMSASFRREAPRRWVRLLRRGLPHHDLRPHSIWACGVPLKASFAHENGLVPMNFWCAFDRAMG